MKFVLVLIVLILISAQGRRAAPAPGDFIDPIVPSCGATQHICGITGGSPATECSKFGLKPLSSNPKDDYNQPIASNAAAVTLVKAGTCFTVYRCAKAGTALAAADGKSISHVTYCGSYDDAQCDIHCNVPMPGAEAPQELIPVTEKKTEEEQDKESDAIQEAVEQEIAAEEHSEIVVSEEEGGVTTNFQHVEVSNPLVQAEPEPVQCMPVPPQRRQIVVRVKDHCRHDYDSFRFRLNKLNKEAESLLRSFANQEWDNSNDDCETANKKVFAPPKVVEVAKANGEVKVVVPGPATVERTEQSNGEAAAVKAIKKEKKNGKKNGYSEEIAVNPLGETVNVPVSVIRGPIKLKETAVQGSVGEMKTPEGFPLDGDDQFYKELCANTMQRLACDPYARGRAIEAYKARVRARELGFTLKTVPTKDTSYGDHYDLAASMREGPPDEVLQLEALIKKKANAENGVSN